MDPSVGAPSLSLAALDAAIMHFWEDFVRQQIALGRRDVGSMLETTLGFFFEHALQGEAPQQAQQQQLKHCELLLHDELQRLTLSLGGPGDLAAPMPQPYHGKLRLPPMLLEQTTSDLRALLQRLVAIQTHPFSTPLALQHYHSVLQTTLQHVQQQLALALQHSAQQRQALAQRLQVLSPQLYSIGRQLLSTSLPASRPVAAAQSTPQHAPNSAPSPAPAASTAWLRAVWTSLQQWLQQHVFAKPAREDAARQEAYAALATAWLQSYARLASQTPAETPKIAPPKASTD